MASLETRKTNTGQLVYRVRWYQDGARQSETLATREKARKFRGDVDFAGQKWPKGWVKGVGYVAQSTRTSDYTVEEWCTETIGARSGISPRTRADYLRHLNNHLGAIADIELDELTRTQIGAWVNGMESAGLAPKTVKNIHGILSSCLQYAVQDGHIRANHAKGVGLPVQESRETVMATASDFALIRAQLDPHWWPLFDLLLGTGLRWGEATALTVGHVDALSDEPSVRVTQAWRKSPGGGWSIGPPKTRKSRRTVLIPKDLRDDLLPLLAGKHSSEYLIQTKQGRPVNHAHFYNLAWRPALFAAQACEAHARPKWQKGHPIPEPCGCPGTLTVTPRIHDLRHFHASYLVERGVPLPMVQKRLGHESIQTTIDVYGDLINDDSMVIAALTAPSGSSVLA